MTDRVIEDLPGGWRGVVHDLAVTLGLAKPMPGEREAAGRERACRTGIKPQPQPGREAGQ